MNCLYMTLFFNIVAGIVQTFIKSWNQLLYPRVIEVCRQPFEPRHDFFLHLIIVVELSPSKLFLQVKKQVETHIFPVRSAWETSARNPPVLFWWSSVNILGTQRAHNFLYPNFSVTASWIVVLRHFGNDVMQLSYHHASICANFSFNFLKKVVRDQRWPTAPLFVVNISPSFGEFTAPLRHILPIYNVTRNSNNLFFVPASPPPPTTVLSTEFCPQTIVMSFPWNSQ